MVAMIVPMERASAACLAWSGRFILRRIYRCSCSLGRIRLLKLCDTLPRRIKFCLELHVHRRQLNCPISENCPLSSKLLRHCLHLCVYVHLDRQESNYRAIDPDFYPHA